MKRALQEFLRPIPDEAVPNIQGNMTRGVTTLTLVAAVAAPLSSLALIPSGSVEDPIRCVIFSAVLGGLFFAISLVGRTPFGRQRPDLVLIVFVLAGAAAVAFAGWPTKDYLNRVPFYTLFIPALIAGFVPWRPTLSLGLAPPLFAIWCSGQLAMGLALSVGDVTVALVLLSLNSTVAAVANQAHRRLWAHLQGTRAQLAAAERMYGLGRLTAGIAHELKTPVASALNSLATAQSLARELGESIGHQQVTDADLQQIAVEIGESVALATQSTERTATFVHAIREQTRALNEVVRAEIAVASRVEGVALLLSHRLRQSRIVLDTSGVDSKLVLDCDPTKLDQILTNLIVNALDACEESGSGSSIRVTTAIRDQGVAIAVEDDGPGVPEDLRERIFEPLFTTRAGTGGSGLGLAITRDLAEGAFGGRLSLTALPKGSRFELWCPPRGADPRAHPAWQPAAVDQAHRVVEAW